MEPFQPFLIALLVLLLAVSVALQRRRARERRERQREQAVITAAAPRMQSRLAAIGDPSILPEPEPPYEPYVPVVETEHIPTAEEVMTTRRRVWRDASATMMVFASIGLALVLVMPASGLGAPDQTASPTAALAAATDVPTPEAAPLAIVFVPLPTRVAVDLPTEAPTPTLPVTATPAPTQRAAARATPRPTPRPTAKPKPKATPRPTPKPTPIPDPVARFSCSFQGGLRVAFDSTSRYAKRYAWDFDDGTTSSSADPTHTFPGSGGYRVSLTVRNASGSDTVTRFIDLDAGTGCS
jgi:PKD domain-containing protein